MQIGKYNLMRMNDGNWMVDYMEPLTRHKQSFRINNLEEILDQIVKPRQIHIDEFVRVFRLATNPEEFLQDSFCNIILNNLSQEVIPGWFNFTKYEQFIFRVNQFIQAYAIITGVKLRSDEVEPYLLDIREMF